MHLADAVSKLADALNAMASAIDRLATIESLRHEAPSPPRDPRHDFKPLSSKQDYHAVKRG